MFEVEYKTLSVTDALNKYVSLDGIPITPNTVALDTIGGTSQYLSGDFGVDGTVVRWDSTVYGLYTQLSATDKIRIIYDRS